VSSSEASHTWLSQDAYDRLQAELDELIAGRPVIAAEINARREEGDLRENGGYHAAREEQSKAEARIAQLEDMLARANVGETPDDDGVIDAGMQVTVRFGGDSESETFLLGAREMLAVDDNVDVSVYSPQSPLGTAILGKRPGDTASFTAPNGRELSVEIVAAEPFGR
jgi:transcription elongation factor GreA